MRGNRGMARLRLVGGRGGCGNLAFPFDKISFDKIEFSFTDN